MSPQNYRGGKIMNYHEEKTDGRNDEAQTEFRVLAAWADVPHYLSCRDISSGLSVLKSFTNETFASSQPTQFVGLGNYKELLGLTIRKLPPRKILLSRTHDQKLQNKNCLMTRFQS